MPTHKISIGEKAVTGTNRNIEITGMNRLLSALLEYIAKLNGSDIQIDIAVARNILSIVYRNPICN